MTKEFVPTTTYKIFKRGIHAVLKIQKKKKLQISLAAIQGSIKEKSVGKSICGGFWSISKNFVTDYLKNGTETTFRYCFARSPLKEMIFSDSFYGFSLDKSPLKVGTFRFLWKRADIKSPNVNFCDDYSVAKSFILPLYRRLGYLR